MLAQGNLHLRKDKRKNQYLESFLIHLVLIPSSFLIVLPFLWMVFTAFKTPKELWVFPPRLLPEKFVLDNFVAVFTRFPFGKFLFNSLLVGAAVTALQVVTSALAAYALACFNFKGRNLILFLFLGTMMIPPQVTMIPLYIFLAKVNWIDTYMALIFPFTAGAFGIFLMRQFFLSIPNELIDAATIDGCSRLGILRHVVIPLSMPVVASLALFTFLGNWNSYLWPLIVTNSNNMRTIPVGLKYFMDAEGPMWHTLMAASTLALLPMMVLYVFTQKYIICGFGSIGTGLKA